MWLKKDLRNQNVLQSTTVTPCVKTSWPTASLTAIIAQLRATEAMTRTRGTAFCTRNSEDGGKAKNEDKIELHGVERWRRLVLIARRDVLYRWICQIWWAIYGNCLDEPPTDLRLISHSNVVRADENTRAGGNASTIRMMTRKTVSQAWQAKDILGRCINTNVTLNF